MTTCKNTREACLYPQLKQGDCLELLKDIPDKSVDLVLTDPPYNIKKEKAWDSWKTKEQYIAFMGNVFLESQRVLKDNGTMYFFHNDIVQMSMLMEWIRNNTDFHYNSFIVCDKGDFRALSWKNPTDKNNLRCWFNTCEYILCYVKGDCLHTEWDKTGWDKVRLDVNNFANLRKYAYEMMCYIGGAPPVQSNTLKNSSGIGKRNTFSIAGRRSIFNEIGGKADHFTRYGSTQWSLPTEETYNELIEKFSLREWEGFREYESLRLEYESLRFKHNLDENHNNVFKFKRDKGKNFHSCQKPVDILSRLIRCSSNKGDTVLDMFMGSGSTGVAAVNTGRNFIGFELDEKYFEIAKQRIDDAVFSLQKND